MVDECGVCAGDNSSCSDCAGTPNGSSLVDECGDCQSAYCYDYVTHQVSFGACDGATQMWVEANSPSNPYWNQSCTDCAGTVNGDAMVDECGVCGGAGTGDVNGDGYIDVSDIIVL